MAKPLTPAIVKEWLDLQGETFEVRDAWNEIGILTPEGRKHLRVILFRLEHQEPPEIVNMGGGRFRKVNNELVTMDLETADPSKTIPLKFPFGEEEYAVIYPKSIVIVAGSKQAGKTEYLYEFIKLNMNNFKIDLFNSETGAEQMKQRFMSLGIPIPPPIGGPYERYDNFADVIHPQHISVIDYLDLNSEVYLVGTEIDRIFRKTQAAAVIGLQKPPPSSVIIKGVKKMVERDLAYGGGFTAKRAVLYISISNNKLKLLYVKTPKQKSINPQNMTWQYSFDGDGHFINKQRFYGDDAL